MELVIEILKTLSEKDNMALTSMLSPFQQFFYKALSLKVMKTWDCLIKCYVGCSFKDNDPCSRFENLNSPFLRQNQQNE